MIPQPMAARVSDRILPSSIRRRRRTPRRERALNCGRWCFTAVEPRNRLERELEENCLLFAVRKTEWKFFIEAISFRYTSAKRKTKSGGRVPSRICRHAEHGQRD